jgi:putative tricarboxylic transport membrane protein
MDFISMVKAFAEGFISLCQLNVATGILVGTIIGLIVGLLPGIGVSMTIVLILPFLFGVDPVMALPMLCAIQSVNYTGGSITAVLMGIPGSTASVATVLDGYPMTKKGEGGRGVGAAIMASTMGGVVAVLFAIFMMPLVFPVVMAFKSAEMFCIILLAMCFIAGVVRGSMTKGLISGCIGIIMGFVGFQLSTAAERWTFGNLYLYDGLGIASVMLGIFALSVLMDLRTSKKSIAPENVSQAGNLRELWKGAMDVIHHWRLWLISSIIGYIVGVIPGIGAETAIWVAYGQAQKMSKDPTSFGKGNVEGVIAPESANNAKEGGALLTTLAFGIPGSMGMAYMLVAFLVVGLQPGPKMITDHTALSFAMLQTVGIANILGGLICFFGGTFLLNVTRVPAIYLFVTLIPLITIGAYNESGLFSDVIVMLIVGILGICMRQFRYPFAPAVLGFVLAPFFEKYFWLAWNIQGPMLFFTPISIFLNLCTIFFLFYKPIMSLFNRLFKSPGRKAA